MKSIIPFILILILIPSAQGIEFFSTANVENYRTDLGTTLVSPNLYFKFGRLEGYGFYDRYLEEPQFYHGEFQLIFTPVNKNSGIVSA
jgi:hypothetical protein